MTSNDDLNNGDETIEDQRPRQQSLGGVLRREGNWRCLALSALLIGCIAAAAWCRLAQVQRVIINFSVYPIKRTRQMSPCDDGYIYIPVAFMGLLYLVYLVECYHCTARLQLAHRVDVSAVADRVRTMRLAKPKVWWKAVCYHYVRRKRQVTRYRNGDAYTTTQVYYERVNSHSASSTFAHAYCGFKDVSKNLILDSRGPITKIRFSKGFAFSNIEAASEFEDQRSRFFAEHERFDDYMEMREGLDLVGVSSFKEYMVAYRDTDRIPWYSSHALFWILSCLLLSWPLRILIECNTAYVHYTVTKIFGVNYDVDNNRRLDLETHTTQYTPNVSARHQSSGQPFTNQTATLANQNLSFESENGSAQHINILALARSRNGLDYSGAMSHTSTIDSLELFATIRENCALVPSYSEALLLSNSNASDDTVELPQSTDESNTAQIKNNPPEFLCANYESVHKIGSSNSSVSNTCSVNRITEAFRNVSSNTASRELVPQGNLEDNLSFPSTSAINGSSIDLIENECPQSRTARVVSEVTLEIAGENSNPSETMRDNLVTPRKKLRILEQFNVISNVPSTHSVDDNFSETESNINGSAEIVPRCKYSPMHTTQSNYSLRTANNNSILTDRGIYNLGDKNRAQNRKSWAGFLTKPAGAMGNNNRIHGNGRVRPVPFLNNCRRNSLTETLIKNNNTKDHPPNNRENENQHERLIAIGDEETDNANNEEDIPISQIESIDRNLRDQDDAEVINRSLYFASPLLEICPADPFGGRVQTTPTEDPPPYDVAVNLPVLRRITRSVTDRGELFGQSRAFISDTLLNRRSCVDNVVSGTDAVRLIQNSLTPGSRVNLDMETIL